MDQYLSPGRFIDSDSPHVVDYARRASAGASGDIDQVRRLYGAVRDGIAYDPYVNFADPANFRAGGVLAAWWYDSASGSPSRAALRQPAVSPIPARDEHFALAR